MTQNPYEPPKTGIPPEENDPDPDWIYRETFGYLILLVALFFSGQIFMEGIKQLCEKLIENLSSLPF